MLVFYNKKELHPYLKKERDIKHTIGLVPTMGALHQGHISLIHRALAQNHLVVVSIFVNPTQFDKKDDLDNYPRSLDKDMGLLKQVSERIVVFAPSVNEMYGELVVSQAYHFDGLDKVMEGEFRDGQFDGVGTIVETLLRTVAPNKAYFGEKDFQQLQIIKKMVKSKSLPFEIIGCPIEREPHGLAMSSRNERLSPKVRTEAKFIYETLLTAKTKFGTDSAIEIMEWVKLQFEKNTLLDLEYFQIADEDTLTPLLMVQAGRKYRAFIAVYANDVRLIDNLKLN